MKLATLIISSLLALSFLLASCASDQLNLQQPLQQAHDHPKLSQPSLPRKLDHETVKSYSTEEDVKLRHEFRQASPGTKHPDKEQNATNGEEDEEEGPIKSEYFTMDYGWVRRRRPIHNKQLPFIP